MTCKLCSFGLRGPTHRHTLASSNKWLSHGDSTGPTRQGGHPAPARRRPASSRPPSHPVPDAGLWWPDGHVIRSGGERPATRLTPPGPPPSPSPPPDSVESLAHPSPGSTSLLLMVLTGPFLLLYHSRITLCKYSCIRVK